VLVLGELVCALVVEEVEAELGAEALVLPLMVSGFLCAEAEGVTLPWLEVEAVVEGDADGVELGVVAGPVLLLGLMVVEVDGVELDGVELVELGEDDGDVALTLPVVLDELVVLEGATVLVELLFEGVLLGAVDEDEEVELPMLL
jgi:hypothetical protein